MSLPKKRKSIASTRSNNINATENSVGGIEDIDDKFRKKQAKRIQQDAKYIEAVQKEALAMEEKRKR